MKQELHIAPRSWLRGLQLARVGVGFAAVIRLYVGRENAPVWLIAFSALYFGFSLATVFWSGFERPWLASVPFLADLAFFMMLGSSLSNAGPWLASAAFLVIILGGALFNGWLEVAIAVACGALMVAITPLDSELVAAVILVGGVTALVLTTHVTRLSERLALSLRNSIHHRAQAEVARETERQRIAADFHDGPLQSFISFQMRLEILRKLLERNPPAAKEELAQLQQLCRDQVAELRAFVRGMRPADLVSQGLAASIRRLVEDFQKVSGIPATFVGGEIPGPADPEVPLELLQIVREALHNVQKHSNASRVRVTVARNAGLLDVAVDDDGRGFAFSGVFTLQELDRLEMGPASIRKRVGGLGGDLTVDSQPGRGASLRIRIPA